MALIALFLAILLIVAAVRNSQGSLFSALGTDVPKFVIWAAAIIAVGAIGAIPGLKPVSRILLALVVIVIIVNNYGRLTKGFQNAWQTANKQSPTSSGTNANAAATGAAAPAGSSFGAQMQALFPNQVPLE